MIWNGNTSYTQLHNIFIICEQTNLKGSRNSTVFGSDCLIEMYWIHLWGCTIVPRFTIKQLRARTSSRILLSFSNTQGFNSRYLDVFPNNIIVFLQGFYPKKRGCGVGLWLGCQHTVIMCELTFGRRQRSWRGLNDTSIATIFSSLGVHVNTFTMIWQCKVIQPLRRTSKMQIDKVGHK